VANNSALSPCRAAVPAARLSPAASALRQWSGVHNLRVRSPLKVKHWTLRLAVGVAVRCQMETIQGLARRSFRQLTYLGGTGSSFPWKLRIVEAAFAWRIDKPAAL
jgi:hypothetical protein